MRITEFADVIMADLKVRRYANQNERWTARFEHCETKENKQDCCLAGEYGNGASASEAIANYAKAISGKILVFNAMDKENRREFCAPALEL